MVINDANYGVIKIPGHSTKREWAVYIIIAKPLDNEKPSLIYIGKTGDNRKGCNPVISRVGNHFSFSATHSQFRNRLGISETEQYNYEYHYRHFGTYEDEDPNHHMNRDKINELERELNRIFQIRIKMYSTCSLLNPFKGNHVSKKEATRRANLLRAHDISRLVALVERALLNCR